MAKLITNVFHANYSKPLPTTVLVARMVKDRVKKCKSFRSFELQKAEYGYKIILSCRRKCSLCPSPSEVYFNNRQTTSKTKSIPNPAIQDPVMKINNDTKTWLDEFKHKHQLRSLSGAVRYLLEFYDEQKHPKPEEDAYL